MYELENGMPCRNRTCRHHVRTPCEICGRIGMKATKNKMNEEEYTAACLRYEEVKYATEGEEGEEHDEKMMLVAKIAEYEEAQWESDGD